MIISKIMALAIAMLECMVIALVIQGYLEKATVILVCVDLATLVMEWMDIVTMVVFESILKNWNTKFKGEILNSHKYKLILDNFYNLPEPCINALIRAYKDEGGLYQPKHSLKVLVANSIIDKWIKFSTGSDFSKYITKSTYGIKEKKILLEHYENDKYYFHPSDSDSDDTESVNTEPDDTDDTDSDDIESDFESDFESDDDL